MSAKTSDRGRKLIAKWEGLYLTAYQDSVGIWTIGYGSITNPAYGISVYRGLKIDKETATRWLEVELADKDVEIARLVKVPLTQNQFDALSSFTYNCGVGALQRSTLLRRLNAGEYTAVPGELAKYTHAGGKYLRGLANRRRDEIKMWNGETVDSIPDAPIVRVNPSLVGTRVTNVLNDILGSSAVKAVVPILTAAIATVSDVMTLHSLIAGVVGMAIGAYIMYSFDKRG